MHPDRIKGNWKQLKGNIMQLWGKITFDQLDVAAGKCEYLSGQIQESNGIAKENVSKRRIARGNSQQEVGSYLITPEIELYNSPNLGTYTGSISTILFNSRNQENQ